MLPESHASVPVDLDQVLNAFDPATRARTTEFLGELGTGLTDQGQNVNQTLAGAPGMLSSLGSLASAINARTGAMRALITSTQGATAAFDPVRENLVNGFQPEADALHPFVAESGAVESTLEQALDAPIVVTPFGLYDCAPQSDGAASLVLAAEDVVDRFTDRPVWIRGVGLGLDSVMHQHKPDMTTFPATTRAAKQAFAMAGMTPSDVDVAEVHDFFTGIELISYEDLGFAERFGGYKLVEAEVTSVGGALPVNPSGGLKAKGHPPGATGVAQCVELFAQLRGEAANQVDRARVALAHNIGGPTAVSAVTILEGPANGTG